MTVMETRISHRSPRIWHWVTVVVIPLTVGTALTSCATSPASQPGAEGTTSTSTTSPTAGEPGQAGPAGAPNDCSGATTSGYDLFVASGVTVTPKPTILSLDQPSTSLNVAIANAPSDATYSYDLAYIQPKGGEVSPAGGGILFDDDGDGTFTLQGPQVALGVTGGPFAGFVTVSETTNSRMNTETGALTADVRPIARVCVRLG